MSGTYMHSHAEHGNESKYMKIIDRVGGTSGYWEVLI